VVIGEAKMGRRLQTVESRVTDIVISTATVDIQVIRIGTKQMTLAVFRQLPYKTIYRKSGALLAPPWGWVNYDTENGTPFVFSFEGILYRHDVRLYIESHLIVKPEQREERIKDPHWDQAQGRYISTEWRPTGSWNLIGGDGGGYCLLTFDSEKDALAHLANRRESLRVLEAAPQLFIGV
jgi:hypothetical protein